MSDEYTLNAEPRGDVGKGASRRLRNASKVPAVVYGADQAPMPVMLDHNEFSHRLANEGFYSHVLTLNLGKKQEKVVLKDLQRHPYRAQIVHADFQRISETEKLRMLVPLHFINENVAPGVRAGGLVSHQMTEVDIECLPKNLPEYIDVDISALEIGDILHLADIKVPEGVELYALAHGGKGEEPVASINLPAAEPVEEEEIEEAEAAEPVALRQKGEESEEPEEDEAD